MLPELAQWVPALGVAGPLIVAGALLLVLGTRSHSRAMTQLERQLDRSEKNNERLDERLHAEEERCDRLEARIETLEQTLRLKADGWSG